MVCLLVAIASTIKITSHSADSTMKMISQCTMKRKLLREVSVKLLQVKAINL
jgi:hypothetical protein